MTSGIPGCGGACVLPSPAPLCRRDPQHCSPTLSEAPLLRAHAQNTSAHQWASHPDHDEDWPQVQMSVTVTPTWSPVRPRQVSTCRAHGVEGGRAWPWLRRHLAGEIGRWSQPPSGPQPPHLSQGVRVGLDGAGTPTAGSPTPPPRRPLPRPAPAPAPGPRGCLGGSGPAAVQSARGSGSSARLLVPASARRPPRMFPKIWGGSGRRLPPGASRPAQGCAATGAHHPTPDAAGSSTWAGRDGLAD
ncbi:lymphocyte antigen 6E isoform X1 [Nomascus leucogenys]|uniref:lymphocyte antigen 6E isoform X1 n=1 Tax=Nomascus leucogenys TaxID=61853 RepID=UPI00122D9214|nr:lymphocyte antigen 6E isoform X1 [Nomascus leucogenys]